jgi:hypothetical protein
MNSLPPGGGGRGRAIGRVGPENHIKLTTYSTEYRIQSTEYRIKLHVNNKNTNVPVFLGKWQMTLSTLM